MFTKAIVRPPSANFAEGLTTAALGAPDYRRALEQHGAYCDALERCGLTLIRLDADPEYPDSCFVEDTAVLVNVPDANGHGRRLAVLTRPGAASRAGETESMSAVLKHLLREPAIYHIEPPGTLDGGDVCEAGDHYFIGVSARTNESGAEQLAKFLAAHGYTSSLIDIRGTALLHLKSGLAHLSDNRLVASEAIAGRQELSGFALVPVPRGEEYAANCVRVNDRVLVASGFERFESTLNGLGHQTIVLAMSEFQKMDGGLSCLSLRW